MVVSSLDCAPSVDASCLEYYCIIGRLVLSGNTKELDSAKLTAFLLYTIYIAVALGGMSGLYSQLMSAVGM